MNTPATTKIQFTIWKPLLESLRIHTDDACLRRDAYLAKALGHEIEILAKAEGKNSELARHYVHGALKSLDCQSATFTLPVTLVDRINEVCAAKQLHRDCFFNRVLLMILPIDQRGLYDWLYSDNQIIYYAWQEAITEIDTFELAYGVVFSQLHTIRESVNSDPLGIIREVLSRAAEKSTEFDLDDPLCVVIGNEKKFKFKDGEYSLVGLNVILPDLHIPGSAENIDMKKILDLI
ncbi:MAG TPA: hypothetical protein PLR30_13800 [Saprospiraceae bacterium]|nr:hypothetical protein [Saprospiraceae bacterium]